MTDFKPTMRFPGKMVFTNVQGWFDERTLLDRKAVSNEQGTFDEPTLLLRGDRPRDVASTGSRSDLQSATHFLQLRLPVEATHFLWYVILIFLSFFFAPKTRAHPAHAEPVDYPFVVGFERFYSSQDDDDYLAEGGLLLLNELNCVTCHAPPKNLKDQFSGFQGTNLLGTGSRLSPVDLEMMIRNPRYVKRDTIMPSLFAGPDRDLAEVEALKHFLVSLRDLEAEKPFEKKGDVDAGRTLYHRIGCVACHAPEKDYRPEDLPEFIELELTGLPSIPMNLADRYSETALARFLLDPLTHRPSGRMPEFKLTTAEAADLAVYLKAGEGIELPDQLKVAVGADEDFVLDAKLVEAGKGVFFDKKCHACHKAPVAVTKLVPFLSKPLTALKTDERIGCLSERPVGGLVPSYFLDEVQKRALIGAIEKLKSGREPLEDHGEIDWAMSTMNCYACHERDGKGGPETAREPYFAVTDQKAYELGRSGNIPPALTHIGRKLQDDVFAKILAGESKKLRTTMLARMPVFHKMQMEALKQLFQKTDALGDEGKKLALAENGDAKRGVALFATEDLKCASCHGENGASFPLTEASDRLQPSFFKEIMLDPWTALPGAPMTEVMKDRPNRDQEIEDLWKFLKSIGK